jgi:hypothetical protein
MAASILIDDDGEPWPAGSTALARRIGYDGAGDDLAGFAVAERGFVHIRPIEGGVRIALRPGAFTAVTLAGTLQILNDLAPRRILLVIGPDDERVAELFTSIFDFIERAEQLASEPAIEPKMPWLAVPRGLHNLTTARFLPARSIVELWRRSRGELTAEIQRAMLKEPMFHRTLLVRRVPGSRRLVTEHIGLGFAHMRPCEVLRTIGQDFADMPDPEYGAWVAEAYFSTAQSCRLRIDSIRARVRSSSGTTFHTRYDRMLVPWRRASDVFVMGASLLRALSATP